MRVFDFDNTVYDGESVIDFYLFSLRRNPKVARYVPVVLYHLLRYKLGRTTMADLEPDASTPPNTSAALMTQKGWSETFGTGICARSKPGITRKRTM